MTLDATVFPPATPATVPKLIPVFILNLKSAADPNNVFTSKTKDTVLNFVRLEDGEIKTVPNELGLEFEGRGVWGTDDLSQSIERGVSRLDCKLYAKTPKGAGIYYTYPGVVRMSDNLVKVVTGESNGVDFEDSYVTSSPKIVLGDDAEEKYKWVENESFIAKGRFVRDKAGVLYVQYYVYVIR